MKQEIFINSSPQESRIAIIEDGQLAEFLIERKEEMGVAGNIYKIGRIPASLRLEKRRYLFGDKKIEGGGWKRRWEDGGTSGRTKGISHRRHINR